MLHTPIRARQDESTDLFSMILLPTANMDPPTRGSSPPESDYFRSGHKLVIVEGARDELQCANIRMFTAEQSTKGAVVVSLAVAWMGRQAVLE